MRKGFERFSQIIDIFACAFWDDHVRPAESGAFFASYRMEAAPRPGDAFFQKDFALRNAARLVSDTSCAGSGFPTNLTL